MADKRGRKDRASLEKGRRTHNTVNENRTRNGEISEERKKQITYEKASSAKKENIDYQKKHGLGDYSEKNKILDKKRKVNQDGEYKKDISIKEGLKDAKDIASAITQTNTANDVKQFVDIAKGVNPFSIKSVNNALNSSLNEGTRIGLDKVGFGMGTIITKVAQYLPFLKKDADGRLMVASKPAQLVMWILAFGIVFLFFCMMLLIIIAVILGASYFAVTMTSGGGDSTPTESSKSSTTKNNKSSSVPAELKGKALMPDMLTYNSNYGYRSIKAYNYQRRMHYGIDYGYNHKAVPIYSNIEGVVIDTKDGIPLGSGSGKGNYVAVYNEDLGLIIVNQHLSPGIKVEKGSKVNIKSVLGYMGNTGTGGAMHLHVESYKNITPEIAKTYNANAFYGREGYVFNSNEILMCTKDSTTPTKFKEGVNVPIDKKCIEYEQKMRGID